MEENKIKVKDDSLQTKELPLFERAIIAAEKRLSVINRQHELMKKIDKIFHTFNRAFEDIQKSLPDATELEAHSDRVCFEIRDVPISVIYVPQAQPTFININKQNVLAEKLFICDKYFGKSTYEMVGPSEREVGGIFVTEDSYLVRWSDGKAFFYPSAYELVDATLHNFFALCDKYKDRYGNELVVNIEDYHYKVTPVDLLTSNSNDLEQTQQADLRTTTQKLRGTTNKPLAPSKNISIYGHKGMKF